MVISDRVSLRPPLRRATTQAKPTDSASLSSLAQITTCPTARSPKGYRALAEQAACAAGGGPATAPVARQLEQFRQGLCPYLAQASQNTPQDLTAMTQAVQQSRLDPVEFFQKAAEQNGGSFQVGQVRVETRPNVVQQILVNTQSRPDEPRPFSKSPLQVDSLGTNFGHDTVFLTEGQPWQERRELMQTFFQGKAVLNDETHAETRQIVTRHLDRWGAEEDLGVRLRELTLDSALHYMFSVELSPEELSGAARTLESAGRQAADQLYGRAGDASPLPLQQLADRLLEGRKPGEDRHDMLQALLDNPAFGDRDVLRHEVLTMALLGHETTANLLSWTLAEVTRSPERLEQVRAEIDAELSAAPDLSQTMGLDQTRDLVRDTAAAHPPNYLLMREAREDVVVEGQAIAAGTQVLMPLNVVNNTEGGKFYSFGSGRRVCMGQVFARMEANLILGEVLKRFDLQPIQQALPGPYTDFSSAPDENRYRLTPRELKTPAS